MTAEADRLRRQGVDVVDLGAGEPDFATPEHVKDAARAALDANFTKYTPSAGILELREAVCAALPLDYGVAYQARGSDRHRRRQAGALQHGDGAVRRPGDEVITHAPYWPTIVDQIKLADATPVVVQTHMDDGFKIHAERDHRRDHAAHQGDHHQLAVQSRPAR